MRKRKVTSFYQRGFTMNSSGLYNAIKKMLKKKIIYTRFDDNVANIQYNDPSKKVSMDFLC